MKKFGCVGASWLFNSQPWERIFVEDITFAMTLLQEGTVLGLVLEIRTLMLQVFLLIVVLKRI